MARLVTTTCPKCGAHVPVKEGADRATCAYCQTVSLVNKAAAAGADEARGRSWAPPLIGLATLLVAGGLAFALLVKRSAPEPSVADVVTVTTPDYPPAPQPAATDVAEPPPAPTPAPTLRVRADAPFFAVDVDGDRQSELVVPVALEQVALFAVFDAHAGTERVRTAALPAAELLAVAGTSVKRLVVSTRLGQLHAYDLMSGTEQWTSALADSVVALCTTRDGALHVTTADQRRLLLDLTTGRQSETRATCAPPLVRSSLGEDPRDRHDYSAPLGVEAYRCGSARVMGSQSYSVPDACHGKIPSALEGMVPHRIWKHGAGWLVFGVRAPGRYVPRVAYLERGRVVWSLDVPVANPLDAEQGGPREVALAGSTLAVLYSTESDRTKWITAFDVTDGHRVFTQELTSCSGGGGLVATEDAFTLRCDAQLRVLSATDGAVRLTIGR